MRMGEHFKVIYCIVWKTYYLKLRLLCIINLTLCLSISGVPCTPSSSHKYIGWGLCPRFLCISICIFTLGHDTIFKSRFTILLHYVIEVNSRKTRNIYKLWPKTLCSFNCYYRLWRHASAPKWRSFKMLLRIYYFKTAFFTRIPFFFGAGFF